MTVAEGRLPRGRHGLTNEEVVRSQRHRMFRAIADATAEKGYAATTVADVLRRAGVSRETFYEQFGSKQDCFAAAFDEAAATLLSNVESAIGSDRPDPALFDHLLGVYLDGLATQPQLARLCLVEVYAAGPEMVERRIAVQQRFADRVKRLVGADDHRTAFACEALVASISSMVGTCLARDDIDGLRALQAPFSELIRAAFGRRR